MLASFQHFRCCYRFNTKTSYMFLGELLKSQLRTLEDIPEKQNTFNKQKDSLAMRLVELEPYLYFLIYRNLE